MGIATCSSRYDELSGNALIKPLDDGRSLTECVLIFPAMVMVNVGETDALLHLHHPIGLLSQAQIVSLPEEVSTLERKSGWVTATLPSQEARSAQ